MTARLDLAGKRFGRLAALHPIDHKSGKLRWLCECVCGNTKIARATDLNCGRVRSCGCLQRDRVTERNTKHGCYGTPTYVSWRRMIDRCTNLKDRRYKDYGGRGIKVCDRWLQSFYAFLEDMGERPPRKTIDRIDVDGDYEPSNCRWASVTTQNRNKRK
jgi:hypothetical protein